MDAKDLLAIELPVFTLGRSKDNFFVLEEPTISRYHATLIQCSLNSYILEDLNSKYGTFVNGVRISRKIIDIEDTVGLANKEFKLKSLLNISPENQSVNTLSIQSLKKNPLDFTQEFLALKAVYEQYPLLKKNCRNRDKMIRTGSIILSSFIGVSAVIATGGAAGLGIGTAVAGMSATTSALHLLSSAGLSMLIPSLVSTLLSTDEKIELIEKEYREKYRCPNPDCEDPFGMKEWNLLAKQKTCRKCRAIWIK